MNTQFFDNQTDNTRDIWAEVNYPLCTSLGLRITPGYGGVPAGIPYEALYERMVLTLKFVDWCNWSEGITSGASGVYPCDVERFLAGLPNLD